MSWSPKKRSKFFKIQNLEAKNYVSDFVGTVVRNSVHFLMSFHLDNWQHWELNAQNHVFVSNFSSYLHRRKRDVKLTAGLIRHTIYIVAYTANINSLLIGWLADWLTDWPTDPPTDLLTDWLTVWLKTVVGILAHSFSQWRTDRLTLWLNEWLTRLHFSLGAEKLTHWLDDLAPTGWLS